MSDNTAIKWADATWNPITGCSVVSPGRTNCYAMRLAGGRLRHHQSLKGLTVPTNSGPVWTGEVRFNEGVLDQPLCWRRPRRIVVCEHGDLFHENVPDAWIDRVFSIMARAPQHVFLVLTKRVIRMREYFAPRVPNGWRARVGAIVAAHNADHHSLSRLSPRGEKWLDQNWRRQHLWLGTSIENQLYWWRIAYLLQEDAAVHFLSYEPALAALDLSAVVSDNRLRGQGDAFSGWWYEAGDMWPTGTLDWVVIGGESGPGARPCDHLAIRKIVDDCRTHNVPVFVKQLGRRSINGEHNDAHTPTHHSNR